MILAHTNYT